jgi:hypothetical protein
VLGRHAASTAVAARRADVRRQRQRPSGTEVSQPLPVSRLFWATSLRVNTPADLAYADDRVRRVGAVVDAPVSGGIVLASSGSFEGSAPGSGSDREDAGRKAPALFTTRILIRLKGALPRVASARRHKTDTSETTRATPRDASRAVRAGMVRRGSPVRVRKRALEKPRKTRLLLSLSLARSTACGGYGALYGAFRSETGRCLRRF